jgi:hypothetical protein
VALGAFEHQRSFLRNPWNWIDVVVLATMLVNVIWRHPVARAFQCLRPLRLASVSKKVQVCLSGLTAYLPGLTLRLSLSVSVQLAMLSMGTAMKGIVNITIVLLVFWYIFAILGVQFFGGELYACSNPCTYSPSLAVSWCWFV